MHRSIRFMCMALPVLACLGLGTSATAQEARGNPNPTLAYNLGSRADWNGGMQFLDIAKMMRRWIGHKPGQWGGVKYEELVEGGYIDENGWVRAIPPGLTHVGTLWQWKGLPDAAAYRTGRYVLTYEGVGDLSIAGDADIIQKKPGRIVFENRKGHNIYLGIRTTDPDGSGDYIRNIKIIPEKYTDLHATGALFNPDWLALIEDARVLRFMDWTRTNNAPARNWATRPTIDSLFSPHGTPVETLIQLANEVGADPWFTIPHQADEDYVRAFASFVRDHLDPRLKIHVEYSNETWNGAFQQYKWLYAQSKADWGKADVHAYHVKKATEVALIWNAVFADQAKDRLVHVLGTQTANIWATEQRLEARTWRRKERRAYIPPSEVFDALAVTPYFGGMIMRDPDLRQGLIAAVTAGPDTAAALLSAKLRDPEVRDSIPGIERMLTEQAALARASGLRLIGYEGGQHVHHSFAVKGLKKDEVDAVNAFMTTFIRSQQMAELYQEIWDVWARVGQGPFMQFTEIGTPTQWGSWGVRQTLFDDVPRAVLLDQLNANTVPWWGEQGGAQYLQGVTHTGNQTSEQLQGTPEEDYLLGRGGDDMLIPGPGNDGVHGGAGFDTVRLAHPFASYQLITDDEVTLLVGPDGTDRLVAVEALEFPDTGSKPLAEMVQP